MAVLFTNHYLVLKLSKKAVGCSGSQRFEHVEGSQIPICVAQQVVIEPYTQQKVQITTAAPRFHSLNPKTLKKFASVVRRIGSHRKAPIATITHSDNQLVRNSDAPTCDAVG